jgi:hypothetical protein
MIFQRLDLKEAEKSSTNVLITLSAPENKSLRNLITRISQAFDSSAGFLNRKPQRHPNERIIYQRRAGMKFRLSACRQIHFY